MCQPSPGAEGFIPSPTHGAKTNVSILKQCMCAWSPFNYSEQLTDEFELKNEPI